MLLLETLQAGISHAPVNSGSALTFSFRPPPDRRRCEAR
jgi:hypothetical protein